MGYINIHAHTDRSNIRLLDCTNSVENLIKTSSDIGYSGIAITDHEVLSAHVEALQVTKKLKEKEIIPNDFKLILGNEIYLVNSLEEVRDNYQGGTTKFPHFVLLAKDKIGHRQLRILSSKAWENSFKTGQMERVPTEKMFLKQTLEENRGHLIASSACLGGELPYYILKSKQAEEEGKDDLVIHYKQKAIEFVQWCADLFGKENFFIEIQPANSIEQIYVNEKLIQIAKYYNLKWIVSTDVHFLRPEDREIHKAYLNSKEGEREIDDFYEACFLQTVEEIKERLAYLDEEDVKLAIENTMLIADMVEDFDIQHSPIIPKIDLGEFEVRHIFKPAYDKYDYINKLANSEHDQDRYLIKLIEDGFDEKVDKSQLTKEKLHIILSRLNDELGELWEISESLNQRMPAYYITTKELIDVIWTEGNSLVGTARGSAAGYYINYLLGITTIDSIRWDLPHWRHIHKSRPDLPDCA